MYRAYNQQETENFKRLWPLLLDGTIETWQIEKAMGRSIDTLRGKAKSMGFKSQTEATKSLCDQELVDQLLNAEKTRNV